MEPFFFWKYLNISNKDGSIMSPRWVHSIEAGLVLESLIVIIKFIVILIMLVCSWQRTGFRI